MRLKELRLIACGPFTGGALELQPGLNLLYGPNEAGKSSALRAVRALLFGFEERTSDNFVHSHPQLRVGGVLVDGQGRRLECVRRKGRRATLRDGDDDRPIDEGELRSMLGGVNEEFFTSVFGIDHQRLREGGEEVVRGEGRVAELLFSAGGVAHLREKQESLQNAAKDLFKPTGRNPRVNAALAEAKSLGDQVRELQHSPERWARHDAERRRLGEKETELKQRLVEVEAARSRLERIRDAKELIGGWKDRRAQLAQLSDVVVLADDAEQRFREENERRTIAAAAKADADKRISELASALEKLDIPKELLSEETRIDALYRRLGSHEKATEDRGVLAGQQRAARRAAKRAVEKLGWDLSVDDAKGRRVSDEKKARVRALSSRHGEVTQGKSRQELSLRRAEGKLAEVKQALAAAENPADPVALRAAVASAVALLEVEVGLAGRREEAERLRRGAEEALTRLPHFSGSLEGARRLEVPEEETVDEFDQSRRDLASSAGALAEQGEANQTERDGVAEKLRALELQESVPTEGELTAARTTRDRGLRLAVQALAGAKPDAEASEAFVGEVGEGEDLATALEPSVRRADDVSDRLRREASRVAEKSQLLARLRSLDAKGEQLEAKLASVKERRGDWDGDWESRWKASGVTPLSPPEMRGWLRSLKELIGLSDGLATATSQLEGDERRVDAAVRELRGALGRQGVEVSGDVTLARLVEATQSRVGEATEKRHRYAELESDSARAADEVEQARQELQTADEALRRWRKDWADALAPLSLDGDAAPEQAEAVLANLDELFRHLDDADGFGTRIWGIDKTATEFVEAAKEMARQAAPDLLELGAEELVTTLNRRLHAAKQTRQQADSLAERLQRERESAAEAEREVGESTAALEAMVAEAGCEGLESLRPAIEASRQKKRLETDVAERERELTPLCGGKPLAEFVAEVEREDADRLPTQVQELGEEIAELRDDLEATIAARQREASELAKYDGSAAAADKAEERLAILARVEADVREYVVAIAAERLLQRAVERYQERSQGPVLAGASEYFRLLTRDSFESLKTDYDESGREVLVGVRSDGGVLSVAGMSEGTRDQLYLALRLGTLDHWFESHEPIPFIVDDVLLTFDDDRATAALRALVSLATRAQVLLFTHHEHIVSIVRDSEFAGAVSITPMPGASG
ncbi:YhaN family protein [Botrimarina hoheduenensis]|uniref:YhaN AAA domain-containing protein n=1 Tax=Botrimarina hoheduenensis TaxID=2528000 RepID=A0A5C5WFV9_9BACT|nr:YhaN family protein [Botrimarina hoheduenensis]TWT48979.1 hypothetical protein Pla111_07570 [Botrimarina hoheduenensis]